MTTPAAGMDTCKDVLAAVSGREGEALRIAGRRTPHSAAAFATACNKAANLLRHYGVHPGADCAVVLDAAEREAGNSRAAAGAGGPPGTAAPLTALLGAAAVGATVTLAPEPPVDARALVLPQELEGTIETTGRCSTLVFGDPPEGARAAHFESQRWSQNPVEPPEAPAPGDTAFAFEGRTLTHEDCLAAATSVVAETGLTADQWVVLETALADADALVAGLLAPLAVGAPVLLRPTDTRDADSVPDDVASVAYRVDGTGSRDWGEV